MPVAQSVVWAWTDFLAPLRRRWHPGSPLMPYSSQRPIFVIAKTSRLLWRRATNKAAIATFIFVTPFVAAPFIWGSMEDNYLTLPFGGYRMHLFNFAFVLWVVAAVFMFVVSLITKQPDQAKIKPFVWSWTIAKLHYLQGKDVSWYQRIGFWALIAGGMYVVIYIKYW